MKYEVIKERAGDGTLCEVRDLTGKVVSRYPMTRNAAERYAEFLNADAQNERDQLAVTERA